MILAFVKLTWVMDASVSVSVKVRNESTGHTLKESETHYVRPFGHRGTPLLFLCVHCATE